MTTLYRILKLSYKDNSRISLKLSPTLNISASYAAL